MRNSKWLVVAGLALVAAFAPGCQSSKCDEAASKKAAAGGTRSSAIPSMSAYPGVVEIYRFGEARAGYVCVDPGDPNVSWWLLRDSETPPVMPRSTSWLDDVVWHMVSTGPLAGNELCSRYGGDLPGARLWRVTRDAGSECVVWTLVK